MELTSAPYAWGCEIGQSAPVALVDEGFQRLADITSNVDPNRNPTYTAFDPTHPEEHGTQVLSILASQGNDSVGMAGVMWSAQIRVYGPNVTAGEHHLRDLTASVARIELAAREGARAINLSQGIKWNGFYTGSPSDLAYISRFRDLLAEALARLSASGVSVPLLVLSAGNDGIPASANGLTALAAGPDSAVMLVVGAIDEHRGRWDDGLSGSNTGALVTLAAPGEDVVTMSGSGSLVRVTGTSYAAPFVTGIAGLLLSFDPRLSGAELRQLIVEGARRGGRFAAGFTQPVLIPNAYESLRAAAERPGAALCGNRVWAAGGAVYADRGGSAEQLFQLGEPGGYLTVYHGGRRLDVDVGHGFGRTFTFAGGGWSEVADPSTLPPGLPSGASSSLLPASHDRDTLIVTTPSGSDTEFHLALAIRTIQHPDPPQPLGALTVPVAAGGGASCLWHHKDGSAENWACKDTVAIGTSTAISLLRVAYSPVGDRAIIAFVRRKFSGTVTGDFVPCRWADSSLAYLSDECRARYSNSDEVLGTDVYAFDIRSGTSRMLFTVPGREVVSLSVGETGLEAAVDTRVVSSSQTREPADSGVGFVVTDSSVAGAACQIEFRDLSTGAGTQLVVPTTDPCATFLVGGSMAPLRAASGPRTISLSPGNRRTR